MIDIHTHLIPFVDDGATSFNDSLSDLKEMKKLGVTDVILTPHYRHHMFNKKQIDINKYYEELVALVNKEHLGLNLYLGREIYYDPSIYDKINSGELISINNSMYYLLEFNVTKETDISEIAYTINKMGVNIIIAHIERYLSYISINDVKELRDLGCLIQVNAESLVGFVNFKTKRFSRMLLKNDLIDFIASDKHINRVNYMAKCQKYVLKKKGQEISDLLFVKNPINYLIKKRGQNHENTL